MALPAQYPGSQTQPAPGVTFYDPWDLNQFSCNYSIIRVLLILPLMLG